MNFSELITESRRDEYYKKLYIDTNKFKKQRISALMIGFFVGLVSSFGVISLYGINLLGIVVSVLLLIVFSYLGWKYQYMQVIQLVKRQDSKLSLMFPEFLQTFIALLEAAPSSSILTVLETTIPYLKPPIKQQVVRLVSDMYRDGSNESVRESMLKFSSYINSLEANRIMNLVYSMYVDGANPEMLKELDAKVQQLNENKVKAYVSKKANRLKGTAFPALVLGIIFVFGYIGIIGSEYLLKALGMM